MSVRNTWVLLVAMTTVGAAGCTDDDGGVADVEGGACSTPLDAEVLGKLTTGIETHFDMRPGTSRTFELGTSECCYSFEQVDACVTWTVSPATGAAIDANGVLTVDASAKDGDMFTVTADVEDGRKIVTSQVYIYTPEGNPLFGIWHEQSQLSCENGGEVTPARPIGELRFRADHTINVTWQPFELYVDYWGTYTYDSGAFAFDVTGGNYVPTDIDSTGELTINADGALVLNAVWLGSPNGSGAPAQCGHVFTR